jgi:hypothetical protein
MSTMALECAAVVVVSTGVESGASWSRRARVRRVIGVRVQCNAVRVVEMNLEGYVVRDEEKTLPGTVAGYQFASCQ